MQHEIPFADKNKIIKKSTKGLCFNLPHMDAFEKIHSADYEHSLRNRTLFLLFVP